MRVHLRRVISFLLSIILIYGLISFIISDHHQLDNKSPIHGGKNPHLSHELDLANDPVKHRRRIPDQGIGPQRLAQQGAGGLGQLGPLQDDAALHFKPQTGAAAIGRGETTLAPTGWPFYSYFKSNGTRIWPAANDPEDRVINQLHTVPTRNNTGGKLKKILIFYGLDSGMEPGQSRFIEHKCPVNQCSLTGDAADATTADLILFKDGVSIPAVRRPSSQIWLIYMLESPFHTTYFQNLKDSVNWTATYRRDSTIVAPYERFSTYANVSELPKTAVRDFSEGKTKTVAWFVSNCNARNGRGQYAAELGKYVQLDIYGSCGTLSCTRYSGGSPGQDPCSDMLRKDYKFYLAFENSNCRDYITEKLYWNALLNDVIPIVMGARREDYELAAPPGSFIHVDDFASPRELAEYIKRVSEDNDLFNSYFRWQGTGQYIDTKFWCRLCAMLHETRRTGQHSVMTDMDAWWRGPGVCVEPLSGLGWATWRNNTESSRPMPDLYKYWTEQPPPSRLRHFPHSPPGPLPSPPDQAAVPV